MFGVLVAELAPRSGQTCGPKSGLRRWHRVLGPVCMYSWNACNMDVWMYGPLPAPTSVSDSRGEQWHTHSLTDTHTGKATPFSMGFPSLPLPLKMSAAWV